MASSDDDRRAIQEIRLPLWGGVVASDGATPWLLVDGLGNQVEPVAVFLRDLAARDRSAGSIRGYALALLRWWRFLVAIGLQRATSGKVRDFVLWLGLAVKPMAARRTASRATVGQVNPVTKKRNPGDGYGPATIRHSNAVLRTFYDFWLERCGGPLIDPVVVERSRGSRANAHHNPMVPFRAEGRLRYNPRMPKAGTNWTMHDLRHTCAIRMVRDDRLTLRDVQTILGHAHLSTTQIYLEQDDEEVFARVREHQASLGRARDLAPTQVATGYGAADLAVLFGWSE